MTSPIDPIRRTPRLRRKPKAVEDAAAASKPGLPVPVDGPQSVSPAAQIPPGAATFDAQILGQHNERRGLRGGPAVIDRASATYNRVEWSGSKDRRARKGGKARTDV